MNVLTAVVCGSVLLYILKRKWDYDRHWNRNGLVLSNTKTDQPILSLLKKYQFIHIPNVFSESEVKLFNTTAKSVKYAERGLYLGDFVTKVFGINQHTSKSELPPVNIVPFIRRLESLVPNQKFSTIWVQKYETNLNETHCVNPHYDPANYLNSTIIAVFGEFKGGLSIIEKCPIQIYPGDVLILRSKLPDLPMPLHEVTNVTQGTRYTLILSEIADIK